MGILLDTFRKDIGNGAEKMLRSKKWLYDKLSKVSVNRAKLIQSGTLAEIFIGKMFLFTYDPKTKDKLPFYDIYPLVIPIETYGDGFLGLNLHYLEPGLRIALLDKLHEYASNKKMDKTTRLKLSYSLISNTSRLSMAMPCVKKYLYSHVQSQFVFIEPDEWIMASFLPIEKFAKATKNTVWADSRNKL